MWRWVTRGLVLASLALLAPALFAQGFVGSLDSPDPARTQTGVILVQGWALNPLAIAKIELWVDDQYIQDAVMNLPRIDIEQAYPDYPGIHESRPGFVTGFLASRFTNGAHTVEIHAVLSNGDIEYLGRRTINIDNTMNQAPFGYVDIPGGSGTYNASGSFPVSGWAADTDGIERIEVAVDGNVLQGAVYGDPRPDVGETFPDFPGALFSGYVAHVDTTRIQNGVHLLTVRAYDPSGMSTTIGTRQVQVINNDSFLKPFGFLDEPQRDAILYGTGCGPGANEPPVVSPPIREEEHITRVSGWALDLGTRLNEGRVSYVELLVDGQRWLSTDDCGIALGRYANCYGIPRYDVAHYYPTYPDAPRAGFLFTLDVGDLLKLGVREGNHQLMVRVGDREQTFANLPNDDGIPVWFQCADNTDVQFAAFGFIEFPNRFDYVNGTILIRGWALHDRGTLSAIEILIDGTYVGTAQYGFPRPDVKDLYPDVVGQTNSGWQFSFDTRVLTNARHRVTARAVDNRGNRYEIGSVDFYTENGTPTP